MNITSALLSTSIMLLFAACSEPAPPQAKPADSTKYQGREDTRSLQNADNIGYDGTGIQKKLDKALDQNEQRTNDLNNQIDAQTSDEVKPDEP